MSAIGRLWFKWVSDPHKPTTIEDVPSYWRTEVEELVKQHEAKEEEEGEENNEGVRAVDANNRGAKKFN